MAKQILGAFSDTQNANAAVDAVKEAGYSDNQISVITRDENVKHEMPVSANRGDSAMQGAATGAATGGVVGAIAGLLTGVGAIAIPGIGGLLVGGPLAAALGLTGAAATTLTGAATGAVGGGLVGGLIGLGLPQEDAHTYERIIKDNGVIVGVDAQDGDEKNVAMILSDNGAEDVRTVG